MVPGGQQKTLVSNAITEPLKLCSHSLGGRNVNAKSILILVFRKFFKSISSMCIILFVQLFCLKNVGGEGEKILVTSEDNHHRMGPAFAQTLVLFSVCHDVAVIRF